MLMSIRIVDRSLFVCSVDEKLGNLCSIWSWSDDAAVLLLLLVSEYFSYRQNDVIDISFIADLLWFQYESGAATAYISRKQALKKLQLSLPDFRYLSLFALCGVHLRLI